MALTGSSLKCLARVIKTSSLKLKDGQLASSL